MYLLLRCSAPDAEATAPDGLGRHSEILAEQKIEMKFNSCSAAEYLLSK